MGEAREEKRERWAHNNHNSNNTVDDFVVGVRVIVLRKLKEHVVLEEKRQKEFFILKEINNYRSASESRSTASFIFAIIAGVIVTTFQILSQFVHQSFLASPNTCCTLNPRTFYRPIYHRRRDWRLTFQERVSIWRNCRTGPTFV